MLGDDLSNQTMRFATWNLRYPGTEQAHRRVAFLNRCDWDVIALQEVSRRAWDVITESGIAQSCVYTLEGFEVSPLGTRPHGVALLARNGFVLSAPQLVPSLPKIERMLAATITVGSTPVTVASWHAPNAAGEGVTTKMQGYRGIVDWLNTLHGPTVLGFDSNHWSRSVDLGPRYVPDSDDPWLLENQFFGSNEIHTLRDAFLDYLQQNPLEYKEIIKQRPQGPLAISYVRGSKKNPIEDRFDYIFVSDEVSVSGCSYSYQEARAAGSDHGIVVANLILPN